MTARLGGGRGRVRIATVLATWFGCGRAPFAPGTVGTLGAIPLYLAIRSGGPPLVLLVCAVVVAVGVWASSIVAKDTGNKDPQCVVIDEVAGVLLALSVAHTSWLSIAAGVLLFRFFDMTKVEPARWAERSLPGGWGIVMDDVFAGVWAAGSLALLQRFGVV